MFVLSRCPVCYVTLLTKHILYYIRGLKNKMRRCTTGNDYKHTCVLYHGTRSNDKLL